MRAAKKLECFVNILVEVLNVRHKHLLVDIVLLDDHSSDLAGVIFSDIGDDGRVNSVTDQLLQLLRVLNRLEVA